MGSHFSQIASTGVVAFLAGAWMQALAEDRKQISETKVMEEHKRLLLQKILGYKRRERVEPLKIFCDSDKCDFNHDPPQACLSLYKLTNNKTIFMTVYPPPSSHTIEYSMDIAQVYGATSLPSARERLEELGDTFLNLLQWDDVTTVTRPTPSDTSLARQ